jgi:hypothetical protein
MAPQRPKTEKVPARTSPTHVNYSTTTKFNFASRVTLSLATGHFNQWSGPLALPSWLPQYHLA